MLYVAQSLRLALVTSVVIARILIPGHMARSGRAAGLPITERRGCQPLATRQLQKSVAVQRGSAAALVAVQH